MDSDTFRDPSDLEALLDYVKEMRKFDFSGYKRPTLFRRIGKRMEELGCETYAEYQDYLEVHPEEFVTFFNTVLINVTSFFRDPEAWTFVADEIVPRIISGKDPDAPIRIWSAGCASGEEAYTLAMVFAEALGVEEFRNRVKVYATDVDEEALAEARAATYTSKSVEAVPERLREKYFESSPTGLMFRTDLRRSVIFGRLDLMRDAPISRLDVLVCRNTLMYFNADAQAAILDRFRFALNDDGYLFLGRAETLLTHSTMFRPLQLRLRVFESVRDAVATPPRAADVRPPVETTEPEPAVKLRDAAFDAAADATMVIDRDGVVHSLNAAGRALLDVAPTQLGRPLRDLDVSYRPLELRSVIDEAYAEQRAVERHGIEWSTRDGIRIYDVYVAPLSEGVSGAMSGVSVTFTDVTRFRALETDLARSSQELQTAYEELQSTNEELETMNEELHSTNEELQSTNEELQSTNEELETMNEELHSTNDEFQAVNDMLNARGVDLDRANTYLHSILTGIGCGVVVLDHELVVRVWNHWSEDVWGLRPGEAEGKHLMNLDVGLPVAEVVQLARRAMEHDGEPPERITVEARSRRGRDFKCRVTCARTTPTHDAELRGVILLMEAEAGELD